MRRDNDRFKVFTRRAALLAGGKLLLFSALAGRMYYLQVRSRDEYQVLAEENRIDLQLLAPPRGRIFDRFGTLVAGNRQNYRVLLVAEQTPSVEETLARLARLIPLGERDYRRLRHELERKRDFVPITLRENLSWEQFASVNVHSPDLPGVQPDIGESRHYTFGPDMAHVVGYVGEVSEEERTGEPLLDQPGFRIGKSGIERTQDELLRGKAGNSKVEVNAVGRVIRELQRDEGDPGQDVVLTVASGLQRLVSERLEGESAAAVVLDVHGGEVLALASAPSFDPNAFSRGIKAKEWRALLANRRKPLLNKAVAGQYPPGSTFKMMVALAALESGVAGPDHRTFCKGWVQLGRSRFHCWKRGGHGWKTMIPAIEESCDVYFYDLAQRVGIDRIGDMARRFGLGEAFDFGLPGVKRGLVPTREWKLALQGVPWQLGETLITGIGQGYLLATPLQLAVMVARIANGGYGISPRLVLRAGGGEASGEDDGAEAAADEGPPPLGISSASLRVVWEGMERVSNSRRGTAYRSRIKEPGMALAGKTGTSQVRRISKAERAGGLKKNEERPWRERDHALFVAYAPVSAPRYATAVVVEHGGSGSRAAAPVARDILLAAQRLDPLARAPAGILAERGPRLRRG